MATWFTEWWSSLTQLNQMFFAAAAFFSIFFLWQLLAALMGLGGEEVDVGEADVGDLDVGEADVGDLDVGDVDEFEPGAEAEAAESMASFKLLSIRSIISFFTLFTWGGALYLYWGTSPSSAMGYSVLWGLAGMCSVALIFWGMRKLTKAGTSDLRTCVGKPGTVYLDIPGDGMGEVRVTVSGVVSYVKARSADGKELKAGTPIRVVRRLDQTTVEVVPVDEKEE